MTKRFLTLSFAIGLATTCAVQAQSPTPGESPAGAPPPAKHRTHKKAETTASSGETAASASPRRRPRLRRQPSAVAKKRRLVQQLVRLHRLHLLLPPQLGPKQKVLAKKRRQQRVRHRHLANSRSAVCSSRKVLRRPVRQPRPTPPQRAEAPTQQLIPLRLAEAMVWCGLTRRHMFTTEKGRVFTARRRRGNT